MLPAARSSKGRMVTGPHLVFTLLLQQTELNTAPVKNGTCNMTKQDPCFVKQRRNVGETYIADNPT